MSHVNRSAIAQMRVPAEVVIAEANNTRPKPGGGEPSPSGRSRNRAAIAPMVKVLPYPILCKYVKDSL